MNLTLERGHGPDTVAMPQHVEMPDDAARPSGLLQLLAAYDAQLRKLPWANHVAGLGIFTLMLAVFVLWGATRLEIGPQEARLGMAAREPLGPVGQSFGGLDPAIYPGPLAAIKAWSVLEEHGPGQESMRWPAAIFAGIIGVALTLRSEWICGKTAALTVGFCWLASLAVVNRSGEFGLDFFTGLGVVLALNSTITSQGRLGLKIGLLTSAAFLCGGLTPVILVVAASVILCRNSAGLTLPFLAVVLATVGGWSAWALNEISAEAWAASIALPVTFRSGSSFPTIALSLCLPMAFAAPAAFGKKVRDPWAPVRQDYVSGWWTVSAMCLFVGTILPQFARAALLPVVAGCSVVSGHVWATALKARSFQALGLAGRWLAVASGLLVGAVVVAGIPMAIYVSMAIPYYRAVSLVWAGLLALTALVCVKGLVRGETRRVFVSLVLLAVGLKLAHTSIYVPEWNYRRGQGPWGRAVGQWVPAKWPIYTLHGWSTDFAYATGHNFRQLTHPRFLPDPAKTETGRPSFILLHPADFERWPKTAPPIVKVFEFYDQSGRSVRRVLARTGPEQVAWSQHLHKKNR